MLKNTSLFAVGALGYGLLEYAWRGYTHWSMLVLGGVCFLFLYQLAQRSFPLIVQCFYGALGITLLELATGLLCNVFLRLGIWDYSTEWGNVYGQICPRYSLLWFLLCLPIFAVLKRCQTEVQQQK